MSEEITAELTAARETIAELRKSLKAVTGERSTLKASVEELTPYRDQVASLQTQLKTTQTRHDQDLHLTGLGISSKRGRRAIRREYSDHVEELGDGDAPEFSAYVEELKTDPLYGRWFEKPSEKREGEGKEEKTKAKRKPAGDPNGGAGTPKQPTGPINLKQYNEVKRAMGAAAALALVDKYGMARE